MLKNLKKDVFIVTAHLFSKTLSAIMEEKCHLSLKHFICQSKQIPQKMPLMSEITS